MLYKLPARLRETTQPYVQLLFERNDQRIAAFLESRMAS
jgi:hypothetical protein